VKVQLRNPVRMPCKKDQGNNTVPASVWHADICTVLNSVAFVVVLCAKVVGVTASEGFLKMFILQLAS